MQGELACFSSRCYEFPIPKSASAAVGTQCVGENCLRSAIFYEARDTYEGNSINLSARGARIRTCNLPLRKPKADFRKVHVRQAVASHARGRGARI
jgi:hypothetical protein